MKKSFQLLFIIVFSFCFMYCTKQDPPQEESQEESQKETDNEETGVHTVILTLTKDASIDKLVSLSENELDEYYTFMDQTEGAGVKNNVTEVHPSDIVIWVGRTANNAETKLEITKIQYIAGESLLTKEVIRGCNGVVAADVVDFAKYGQTETYEIFFKLVSNGIETEDTLSFDPKLQIGR